MKKPGKLNAHTAGRNIHLRNSPDSELSDRDNRLVIWRFTDGKPGHDSQSLGLANALGALVDCEIHDVDSHKPLFTLAGPAFYRDSAVKNLPSPNLIIGAGHKTHIPVFATKRVHNCFSVILMRPSLPSSWFDICLIPEHDYPRPTRNVIQTKGAINTIVPSAKKNPNAGIILIGGPAKHFIWNDKEIGSMIEKILRRDQINWTLYDSPRTPDATKNILRGLNAPNSRYTPYAESDRASLEKQIATASRAWVTIDSVTMLYEALTGNAAVGVLTIKPNKKNKISTAISSLIYENQCITFDDWDMGRDLTPPLKRIHESSRCAALLLQRIKQKL